MRAGEILGVAGVSGNGQTALAEVIAAMRPTTTGTVTVAGEPIRPGSVRAVIDAGVGHIPEDRIGVGMVASAPVKDNAVLRSYWSDPAVSTGVRLHRSGVLGFAGAVVPA